MKKLSLAFKRSVLKKLKDTALTLQHKPMGSTGNGWKRNARLRTGSLAEVELKPEIKTLLQNCGITPDCDPAADPAFHVKHSTGEERITVPWPKQFETEEAFYRVLLHELSHWSGRKNRLNREMGELTCCKYHSALGAVEEITAELSSVLLAEHFGFTPNYERAADYINGYVDHVAKMAPDSKTDLLKQASIQASEAADYIASLA